MHACVHIWSHTLHATYNTNVHRCMHMHMRMHASSWQPGHITYVHTCTCARMCARTITCIPTCIRAHTCAYTQVASKACEAYNNAPVHSGFSVSRRKDALTDAFDLLATAYRMNGNMEKALKSTQPSKRPELEGFVMKHNEAVALLQSRLGELRAAANGGQNVDPKVALPPKLHGALQALHDSIEATAEVGLRNSQRIACHRIA